MKDITLMENGRKTEFSFSKEEEEISALSSGDQGERAETDKPQGSDINSEKDGKLNREGNDKEDVSDAIDKIDKLFKKDAYEQDGKDRNRRKDRKDNAARGEQTQDQYRQTPATYTSQVMALPGLSKRQMLFCF